MLEVLSLWNSLPSSLVGIQIPDHSLFPICRKNWFLLLMKSSNVWCLVWQQPVTSCRVGSFFLWPWAHGVKSEGCGSKIIWDFFLWISYSVATVPFSQQQYEGSTHPSTKGRDLSGPTSNLRVYFIIFQFEPQLVGSREQAWMNWDLWSSRC